MARSIFHDINALPWKGPHTVKVLKTEADVLAHSYGVIASEPAESAESAPESAASAHESKPVDESVITQADQVSDSAESNAAESDDDGTDLDEPDEEEVASGVDGEASTGDSTTPKRRRRRS
jgi:hypothetical protein